ncbi:MAG: hypothetical protein CMO97_04005 [Woeseia sp.]|nr:hypothetical protein [Woeseia sp.]
MLEVLLSLMITIIEPSGVQTRYEMFINTPSIESCEMVSMALNVTYGHQNGKTILLQSFCTESTGL